jgi:hypothetical protein
MPPRLCGPSIEIHVGSLERPSDATTHTTDTWTLPVALISKYSPFLRAACTRDFKERQERLIELPEDDPKTFALFVEWMYYGSYNVAVSAASSDTERTVNMDLQCWVLGDKLLCIDFKNYAMRQIYREHTALFAAKAVTVQSVKYVCENTSEESKLMQFNCDFVVTHFTNPMRLKGSTEEWDELMLEHAGLRRFWLKSLRTVHQARPSMKAENEYLDVEPLSDTFEKLKFGTTK